MKGLPHGGEEVDVRSFVTLSLLFLGIVLAVSGVVLYVAPPGSLPFVKVLGLTKSQWELIHTVSAFVSIVLVILHIWFNRRALLSYFRRFRVETYAALALTIFLFVTSAYNLPPASIVDAVKTSIENSWTAQYGVKGFGQMTLEEVCKEYSIPLQKAIKYLEDEYGVKVSPQEKLKDVAAVVGKTPVELVEELKELKSYTTSHTVAVESASPTTTTTVRTARTATRTPTGTPGQGGGYGQMTLEQFCNDFGISLEKAINYISEKYGYKPKPDETIRDIAFAVGLKPYQLVQELQSLK